MPDQLATTIATPDVAGWRADRALAALSGALNRRTAKLLFRAGRVRINGRAAGGAERLKAGDRLEYPAPGSAVFNAIVESAKAPKLVSPHGRHLTRLYEDEQVLVINKPAELLVHRGEGGLTRRDTIEDVLARAYARSADDSEEEAEDEPGFHLVHRLDMETSGCLLIAKTERARDRLIKDFSERRVEKEYLAVVVGETRWDRLTVDKPIRYVRTEDFPALKGGQRPILHAPKKGVAAQPGEGGKTSLTEFRVVSRFRGYTLVHAQPRTGRTHQIRVHLTSVGCPLAYDRLYGRRSPLRFAEFDPRSADTPAGEKIVLNRLPLHAWKLAFPHPATGQTVRVTAPLPRDLKEFLKLLRKFRGLPVSPPDSACAARLVCGKNPWRRGPSIY